MFPVVAVFGICRKAALRLDFGRGLRFRLGAALVRLAGGIVLQALIDRPDLAVPLETAAMAVGAVT